MWAACDGTRTIAEIAGYLRLSVEGANATVAELLERDLLEPDSTIDRRALLTGGARIGATAAVLAPIITIALPAAAAMASTVFTGSYRGQTSPDDAYGINVGQSQYTIYAGSNTVIYVDAAGAVADTVLNETAPTTSPYLAFSLGSGDDLSVTFVIPNGLNDLRPTRPPPLELRLRSPRARPPTSAPSPPPTVATALTKPDPFRSGTAARARIAARAGA